MKKLATAMFIVLVIGLVLGLGLTGCGGNDEEETIPTAQPTTQPTQAKQYTVGITQIVTHPALDANKQGFKDELAKQGFVEGENVKYLDKNPEGDMSLAATIAQQFVSQGVDLILSIATPTSQACVAATKDTHIPVVFGSVTDPVAAGLITSWDHPGGNVTGVSDWLEIPTQIQMALNIMPIKKIGVVYNAGETNSVTQVDQLKAAAPALGISSVVEATVATSADVMTSAQSLVGRVDAIWVGTDNTVVSGFEALVKVCEDNHIPLFASDTASVERGAVAALGLDYYQVGVKCGDIAAKILNGENPANIPAEKMNLADLQLYVNPSAAQRMGITIPQSVIDTAYKVINEKKYTIGITQIVTHPALDANKQGFKDELAKQGFVEGKNVKYLDKNPEGDMSLAATIAQQFVSQKVDLILSIATPTSQACVAATKDTHIPVVFGSVTDPVAAGLITSWDNPGGNVTGVSDWLEIPTQIRMALNIMPIKKIGVVYNAGETNSVTQVDQLKAAAPALGISSVVEATVATSADVMTSAQSLVGRVDAIWVGTDNTVVSGFEALVKVCEDNNIPLFASDTASVERGAVAALGLDYYQVGVKCGDIAAKILNGANPANIPAEKMNLADLQLYVNPSAAQRMGITIPQSVLNTAYKVINQ